MTTQGVLGKDKGPYVVDTLTLPATNTVVTTIAVAKPTAMAINSSGSVLYVANYDAGTVTKISTTTNAVSGAALRPSEPGA